MSFAGEPASVAGLLRILLNRLVAAAVHLEADTSQPLGAGAADAEALALDRHVVARHSSSG